MSVPGPFARGWTVSVLENGIYQEQLSVFFGVRDATRPEIPWRGAGSTPRCSDGVKVWTSNTGHDTGCTRHYFSENARLKSLETDHLVWTSFNGNVTTRLDRLERALAASRQTSDYSERCRRNEIAGLQARIEELEIHRHLDSMKKPCLCNHNAADEHDSVARTKVSVERRNRARNCRRRLGHDDVTDDESLPDSGFSDAGNRAPPRTSQLSNMTIGNYEASMSAVVSPYNIL